MSGGPHTPAGPYEPAQTPSWWVYFPVRWLVLIASITFRDRQNTAVGAARRRTAVAEGRVDPSVRSEPALNTSHLVRGDPRVVRPDLRRVRRCHVAVAARVRPGGGAGRGESPDHPVRREPGGGARSGLRAGAGRSGGGVAVGGGCVYRSESGFTASWVRSRTGRALVAAGLVE